MTPEGKVKAKVKAILKAAGAYYAMPQTGGYGHSGVPDFLICWRGQFIGIECKARGNQPTALQEQQIKQIRSAGGRAWVVNEANVEQLRKELDREDE